MIQSQMEKIILNFEESKCNYYYFLLSNNISITYYTSGLHNSLSLSLFLSLSHV